MRLRDRVNEDRRARVLVGGVGYRFQRDGSFGLSVSDALAGLDWPEEVVVDDLGYGAVLVAHDLAAATPPYDRLVLVAGVSRDRPPGRLYPARWSGRRPPADEIQARVREAGAGVIDLDHLLIIGEWFGSLPEDVRLLELEPVDLHWGEEMSAEATDLLPRAIAWAQRQALAPHPPSAGARPEGCRARARPRGTAGEEPWYDPA